MKQWLVLSPYSKQVTGSSPGGLTMGSSLFLPVGGVLLHHDLWSTDCLLVCAGLENRPGFLDSSPGSPLCNYPG